MQGSLLVSWEEIGEFFKITGRAFKRRYGEETLSLGVVFKMRRGKPPRVFACAWPNVLQLWAALRQRKHGSLDD